MAWGGCRCWISSREHLYVTRVLLWVTFFGLPLHTSVLGIVVVVKAHSGALPGTPAAARTFPGEGPTSVTTQLVGALMILAPVPQAVGAGPVPALRHLVAGARAGVGEMTRHERGHGR